MGEGRSVSVDWCINTNAQSAVQILLIKKLWSEAVKLKSIIFFCMRSKEIYLASDWFT